MRLQMGGRGQDSTTTPSWWWSIRASPAPPRWRTIYAPIRPGTDIAFLNGVMRYLIDKNAIQHEYVTSFTNAGLIVKEGYGFQDGLFSGFSPEKNDYDRRAWDYELDDDGFVKSDPTLQHPRCVYNLLKQHVDRYTPEMVEKICGTPEDKFLAVCELYRRHGGARQGADQHVRAGLDAAFGGQPEHSRHGDDPVAAGQYRRGWRRNECAARPFQHPGPYRYRAAVQPDARLSQHAEGQRNRSSPTT